MEAMEAINYFINSFIADAFKHYLIVITLILLLVIILGLLLKPSKKSKRNKSKDGRPDRRGPTPGTDARQ